MDLSIVTTLYYSARHLNDYYVRMTAAARQVTDDYEIILVDDGSPDESLQIALEIFKSDPRVKIIDLSRNFGQHKAAMTGLAHARGDLVFVIDSDLEEDPELLTPFHAELHQAQADVVFGVRANRRSNFFERVTGELFYRLFNLLSDFPVAANVVNARLMTRRYVDQLVKHREREPFMLGLWTITGFKQVPMAVVKHAKGSSTYTLRRKIAMFVNSVTSFSKKPLILVFYLGCVISAVSAAAVAYLSIRRIFFGVYLEGWPSLIASTWLLGGIMIFCLGVIGIYIANIFSEVKERPYTVVRHVYEHESQSDVRSIGVSFA